MINYKNPVYTADGRIDCEVEHPVYGWIPFTADPNDVESHGREIFTKILEDGSVAPYVPNVDNITFQVRSQRDSLLASTDWTQLPDVPQSTKDIWAPYRQALRDVTAQSGFPETIEWPVAPQ
jgi:hypothetical protein